MDIDEYDNKLSYWIMYNEKPDDLYGTSWDSGVIWEEEGALCFSKKHESDIELYPNFIERIYNELKTYSDLDKWCRYIKENGEKNRWYSRHTIQRADHRLEKNPNFKNQKI